MWRNRELIIYTRLNELSVPGSRLSVRSGIPDARSITSPQASACLIVRLDAIRVSGFSSLPTLSIEHQGNSFLK